MNIIQNTIWEIQAKSKIIVLVSASHLFILEGVLNTNARDIIGKMF